MKRLLMITSAVGLCLTAPAFAQSTTDQDQINKQRANQPSSSAPASQAAPSTSQSGAQDKQQPSSGSSAQAPANSTQNQRGQAQNQKDQQPAAAGSSSSSAQAPASSTQSQSATGTQSGQSQSGQAQNQKQPGSSTSAQAPASQPSQSAPSGQAQNQQMQQNQRPGAQNRSSASLNVNINDQQRTRIAAVLSSSRVRPITNVNFRLDVGVAVPRAVVLHTLPANIVAIVPQFRSHRFFVANDQIVIVEPRQKTIVAVLPAGGTARAQAPAPAAKKISFTDQQREVIRKRASTLRSTATTGSSASRLVVEQEVPATIELEEFPAEIVTEVPVVRPFRFFRQDNDIVVVDPAERRVIEILR
jgi:hypothetical protein